MGIKSYYSARSEEEAVQLMQEGSGRGRYLAGGTDLLCEEDPADYLIDVRALFRYVKIAGDEIVLGATTLVSDLLDRADLNGADGGLLASCADQFASPQIRNMATVGGNLASAVPSADLAPPLLVLGAKCILSGGGGRREVSLEDFFTGPHTSVLGDDLLVEVRFDRPNSAARSCFLKIGRRSGDIAIASAAVLIEMDGGHCSLARIALGSVGPTPFRAALAEKSITGKQLNADSIAEAARLAAAAARPITDQRASAEYRKEISRVLTERALRHCLEEGRQG